MTADAMVGVQEKCLNAGMKDFITKPINPDLMLETIEKWIIRKGQIEEVQVPYIRSKPLPVEIPSIEGINTESGLANVAGNTNLYLELLNKFLHKHENFVDEVTAQFNRGAKEEAMRSMHTLKGLSGNLGMSALHETCKKTEQTLKAGGNNFGEILQPLQEDLSILIRVLRSKLVDKSQASHQTEPGNIMPMIDQLERCLKDNDPEALGIIKDISRVNGYKKQFQQMEKFLENYDFDRALEFLSQIKSKIK